MYSSRWISWFMLIALCLAPLHGGGQAWANRIVHPQVIQAPANIPVQDSAAVLAPLTPSRECRLSPGRITRTSVGRNGMQANGYSSFSDISADGRFVAFESFSNNLVEGDTNDHEDIFVFDRTT